MLINNKPFTFSEVLLEEKETVVTLYDNARDIELEYKIDDCVHRTDTYIYYNSDYIPDKKCVHALMGVWEIVEKESNHILKLKKKHNNDE